MSSLNFIIIIILDWLRKIFAGTVVEPETILPTSTKRATLERVAEIVHAEFPGCPLFLSDNEYLLCSSDDIALFLAQDATNKMGYVVEERDCDDFSYRLMGQFSIPGWSALALGIIWTEVHALNCFITEDEELLLVEPQTDEIQDNLKSWQGSSVRFVMV